MLRFDLGWPWQAWQQGEGDSESTPSCTHAYPSEQPTVNEETEVLSGSHPQSATTIPLATTDISRAH